MPSDTRPATVVIFCSGKIAYELERERNARILVDVAVVRLEQLAPFPAAELKEILKSCPSAVPVYLQEEPENMGAADYVRPRLEAVLGDAGWEHRNVRMVARGSSASPAGSFHGLHDRDQAALIDRALLIAASAVRDRGFEGEINTAMPSTEAFSRADL